MTDVERRNVAVVRRYFDGCNSGDLTVLLNTLTKDVIHYFLDPKFPPIRGAEHLANYWRKYKVARVRSCNDTIRALPPSFLRALRVLRGGSECRVLILVKRQRAGLRE